MDTGVKEYVHAVKNFVVSKQGVIMAQHMVLNLFKMLKKDYNNTCSFFTKIHINHLIIFKNLKISIDKPDQIIIDGNSRVESPKTQVSDKSATSNCFISIGIKYLVFCCDLDLRTYFCVKL